MMIPASYLFKDIYRREWLDPEVEADIAEARRRTGILSPTLHALANALRRVMPASGARHDWARTPAE